MSSVPKHPDPEDLFADTRMSFGDHIEELRWHLWRAIIGLMVCLVIGFVLDTIGSLFEWHLGRYPFGVGRPVLEIIKKPVSDALVAFYDERLKRLHEDAAAGKHDAVEATRPADVVFRFDADALNKIRGPNGPPATEPVEVTAQMSPLEWYEKVKKVADIIRPPELTALSAQEAFFVYFKVSLVCGLVIASPWVFWQLWSFVAAGLYPHEKRYVHVYLPFSLGLFVGGVILCQFFVMPRTVEALLWFNQWLGITPDLRLNEWLGLAILLPVVFGVSFQTPLVMLFMERIGVMDVAGYRAKRKYAIMIMAVFAAVITPTPDAITMCALLLPMVALYELGIWLCLLSPRDADLDIDVPESEEMIEV